MKFKRPVDSIWWLPLSSLLDDDDDDEMMMEEEKSIKEVKSPCEILPNFDHETLKINSFHIKLFKNYN